MTFSIVAFDPETESWGVAVASKYLACAAAVSWARAGAGAVATQSFVKVGFGLDGIALMAEGMSAADALGAVLSTDPDREMRQVGMVDRQGGAAAHTGTGCYAWAGHRLGRGFTCQGNLLTGADVVDNMFDAFSGATGELADRLYAALLAGDEAGGDRRGKQAAGLLVVKAGAGIGGDNDRYVDLRVDDDEEPVRRLGGLLNAHHLFLGKPRPEDRLPITPDIARELAAMLRVGGYITAEPDDVWDADDKAAFVALVGTENLEERWPSNDPDSIDRIALDYLRTRPNLR